MSINYNHSSFLYRYAKADDHFDYEHNPYAYLKHGKNVTSEMLSDTLKNGYWRERSFAVLHPSATREHIEMGLKDCDEYVRSNALKSHLITLDELKTARHDPRSVVRTVAATELKKRGSDYGL